MSVRGPALRRLLIGLAVALLGLGAHSPSSLGGHARRGEGAVEGARQVPSFTLDPSWPKALPNNWVFGGADSVAADRRGHVWVLSRPAGVPAAELAAGKIPAPPVLELSRDGEFVRGWGGPQWVQPWFATAVPLPDYPIGTPAEHGIYVDADDNVWVTGSGHIVLKFTPAGKLLLQIGTVQPDRRQQQHHAARQPDRHGRRHEAQRGLRRRRLPQPPRDRLRLGDRRLQAALGRLRERAERRTRPSSTSPASRSRSSSSSSTASSCRKDGLLYVVRPPARPDPGLPPRRHVRARGRSSTRTPRPAAASRRRASSPTRRRRRRVRIGHPHGASRATRRSATSTRPPCAAPSTSSAART